jgi:cephalosporin hydroxylase
MKRTFETFFQPNQLKRYQAGVMAYEYAGIPCLKSPLDISIYLRLIHDSQCRSIIEVGSRFGGSARLFRDFARALARLPVEVISIDLEKPDLEIEGVRFLEGNVHCLEDVFEKNALYELPRPWLVVEDSAHTASACTAALNFFADQLQSGDYLVIEDGILTDLGLGDNYQGGPNVAIDTFFRSNPDVFEIVVRYCDMFGYNATYNPNGYLQRTTAKFHRPG